MTHAGVEVPFVQGNDSPQTEADDHHPRGIELGAGVDVLERAGEVPDDEQDVVAVAGRSAVPAQVIAQNRDTHLAQREVDKIQLSPPGIVPVERNGHGIGRGNARGYELEPG